ncbi:MAG: hypothetical protein LQ345_004905 [Seirophora villosa]|nr:MAG: hypothetical protein LQ345_004905 [Seirophora villosa]
MPLLFKYVCALLQALEDNASNHRKAIKGWLDQRNKDTVESWMKSHKVTIDSTVVDAVALLSAIFPEARTDRVYSLKEQSLSKILGRCFRLGTERIKQLERFNTPGHGDLGTCVEKTLRQTEHGPVVNSVTLEYIDSTLHAIASSCRFSAPGVREAAKDDGMATPKLIDAMYLRLSSQEAKWLTRMILKDFSALKIKSYHVYNAIDTGLAQALRVHSTFEAAVGVLRHQRSIMESQVTPAAPLKPIIGSKIGRVPYLKGRSVKNVVDLAEGRKMSIEKKYDGEYCQVHINLAKEHDKCIQIFSKSGKDSTVDRQGLHEAIRQSLRIGKRDCQFTRQCILEGEMVVYNELENRVAEFHKIRKHVSRSGSWLGTELDSQAHNYEHLMISFYDVMMIDDYIIMDEPYTTRRNRLEKLVRSVRGRANLTKQKTIDFSSSRGPETLRNLLATAFAQRWEGLVLKPVDAPYFSNRKTSRGLPAHCWIKLKKDYIPGLGDTADFAVVGAGYDAKRSAQLKCPDLKWTHFHIGCLRNKEEVNTKKAKPFFKIIAALEVNINMAKYLNQHGQYCALPFGSLASYRDPFMLDIATGVLNMDVVFQKPFVFDVMGAGFEKEANHDFFTIRFPRVLKIHDDRDWEKSTGFNELQAMAKVAMTVPEDTGQCVAEWMKQLEQVDRGAKGSTVPWDLSDDDVEIHHAVGAGQSSTQATSRRSAGRPSAGPPLVRIDTQEMTGGEERLHSGEVVQRPPSQRSGLTDWSESNLPTPPKSSPPYEVPGSRSRQPLSSLQSTNSTDRRRKHSIEDAEDCVGKRNPKRPRVSPPAAKTSGRAELSASTRRPIRKSKHPGGDKSLDHPSQITSSVQTTHTTRSLAQEPFLVPKLSNGAAEALRSIARPRIYTAMDKATSPDRQTTQEDPSMGDPSSGEIHSTQDSLVADWHLRSTPACSPPSRPTFPDLSTSQMVLSPDVAGMPYLRNDLLSGFSSDAAHLVFQVFSTPSVLYDNHKDKELVILIEGRRHDTSLHMLKYLVGRVPEDGGKTFWVFDWRVFEDLVARGVSDEGRLRTKRMVARFTYSAEGLEWEDGDGKVLIVPRERVLESRGMEGEFLLCLD